LVVRFFSFCCRSTFVPLFFRFAPAQKLQTLSSVVRFALFFKKIFFSLAPFGCPILKVFFKPRSGVWAGACVVSRITHPALRRSSSALSVSARHSNRHPATRSQFHFITLLHLGGDFFTFGTCSNLCHSIAIGLSAHRCLLHLYFRWNCLHSNKTALRWFLSSRF